MFSIYYVNVHGFFICNPLIIMMILGCIIELFALGLVKIKV